MSLYYGRTSEKFVLPTNSVNTSKRKIAGAAAGFGLRAIGYIVTIVLWGKEDAEMYWYNPTTRSSERVTAPSTDEEALDMLSGDPDSALFVEEYLKLRHSGTPIEQALVLVGHEFRLRQPEYKLALR
jgi:hypothetical protein